MRWSKILTAAAVLFVLILTGACARVIIPEEVLQIPEFSPVYTSFNLWYNAEGVITSANIQEGTILPFGTEIQFVEANEDQIIFKRASDGKIFKLKYSLDRTLVPIEQYIRRLFVLQPEKEMVVGVRPLIYEKIKRGIVEKGMTRNEVLLACGPPPPMRTPSETVDTWIYWTAPGVTKRVIFFGDRVIDIIQFD